MLYIDWYCVEQYTLSEREHTYTGKYNYAFELLVNNGPKHFGLSWKKACACFRKKHNILLILVVHLILIEFMFYLLCTLPLPYII